MSHDSYSCLLYPNTQGFPTQRENRTNNFIGAIVKLNQVTIPILYPFLSTSQKARSFYEHFLNGQAFLIQLPSKEC
jgi:hypothetical protein